MLLLFSDAINYCSKRMKLPFLILLLSICAADPIMFTEVTKINSWWPPQNVVAGIGMPGFAHQTLYNHFSLSSWNYKDGPLDLAKLWSNPVKYLSASSQFGSTNIEVYRRIKTAYKNRGIKLLVTAFGATEDPASDEVNPETCAEFLARFVLETKLDGVDINFQDVKSLVAGTGEKWLVSFMKKLRNLLPLHLITHSPMATLFDKSSYKNGGYARVHKEVGNLIDFYNVRFYDQNQIKYEDYITLFYLSNPDRSFGTSVRELIMRNIPSEKIVIAKPASPSNAMNTGYMDHHFLGDYITYANSTIKWKTGVMLTDYAEDLDGKKIESAAGRLYQQFYSQKIRAIQYGSYVELLKKNEERRYQQKENGIGNNEKNGNGNNGKRNNNHKKQSIQKQGETRPRIPESLPTKNNNFLQIPITKKKIEYPIKFAYVNRLDNWWPPENIMSGIGMPGFAFETMYDHFALTFWTYSSGLKDIIKLWHDPVKYLSAESQFGKTKEQIHYKVKKAFSSKGIKLLVSAFGPSQMPATKGVDPLDCAIKLADFVISNGLDGVDIDFEDTESFYKGIGQEWLIELTIKLRELLPDLTLTHAPQAPYFESKRFLKGGYVTVHQKVGNLIDFYNVQFYNQGQLAYDTYEKLFLFSDKRVRIGSSVRQLILRGIPAHKIVIGKPVTSKNAYNTGHMDLKELGKAVMLGNSVMDWHAGVMFWEYCSDQEGKAIAEAAGQLDLACKVFNKCQ